MIDICINRLPTNKFLFCSPHLDINLNLFFAIKSINTNNVYQVYRLNSKHVCKFLYKILFLYTDTVKSIFAHSGMETND